MKEIKDIYNMTKEENIFCAKRVLVDSIYKQANLEGIGVTFAETQDILNNVNVDKVTPTTFERYRKKALHLIIEYTKSPLSVGELITGSSGKIHKPQNRAPAGRVPSDVIEGQIDMMDFLEVPDSGTGNEKEVKHVHKQEI